LRGYQADSYNGNKQAHAQEQQPSSPAAVLSWRDHDSSGNNLVSRSSRSRVAKHMHKVKVAYPVSSTIASSLLLPNESINPPASFVSPRPLPASCVSPRPLVHGVLTSRFRNEKVLFRQSRGCMVSSSSRRCPTHLHLLPSGKYCPRYDLSQVVPKMPTSVLAPKTRAHEKWARSGRFRHAQPDLKIDHFLKHTIYYQ